MFTYEAFNQTLKDLGIPIQALAEVASVSHSRISQFKNGYFLKTQENGKAKGADITSRTLDQLLTAAEQINPRARQVFCYYLCRGAMQFNDPETMMEAELADQIAALAVRLKDHALHRQDKAVV
jgi:hypothetical protein